MGVERSVGVSIRAPREGGDYALCDFRIVNKRFNPRPP